MKIEKIEIIDRKIGEMSVGRTRFDTIEEKINQIIDALQPVDNDTRCQHGVHGKDCFECYPSGLVQKSAEGWERMFIKFGDTTASIKKEGEEWKLILKDDRKESRTHITKLFETVVAQARAEDRKEMKEIIKEKMGIEQATDYLKGYFRCAYELLQEIN